MRNCRFCCVWRQTMEVLGWGSFFCFFYLIQFFGEWDFCWRSFSFWRDFLSYSLVFSIDIGSLLSYNSKNICFYWGFPVGTNIPDGLTNLRSYCILLLLFDWSTNEMCWSTSVRIVSLPHIRFWYVIQSNHYIGTWLIKNPSPRLVGEYFFSL